MIDNGVIYTDDAEQRVMGSARAGVWGSIGIGALIIGVLTAWRTEGGATRLAFAYVANYAFFLSLSLGALFFVLLQHVTRSGWSVVVRRPAEVLAANIIVLAVMFIPIAIMVGSGTGRVYSWAQPPAANHADAAQAGPAAHDSEHGEAEHGISPSKRTYLNRPFFLARWAIYFAVWIGLGVHFWRRSLQQDATGDVAITRRLQYISAPAMIVFAVTLTFAAFDLLMSLDPHWYSTIFGVYYFAGAVVSFFAVQILIFMSLQRRGLVTRSVTTEHYHDMGKLLFAFVFFWGYIAYSQYMLIWYGNIPEETLWFLHRGASTAEPNAWSPILIILLFCNLLLPFGGLMSRHVKRSRVALGFWAVWLLVFHWVDMIWLVMPAYSTSHLTIGLPEICCLVGIGGIYMAGFRVLAAGKSLVPTRDPRLAESLSFENA